MGGLWKWDKNLFLCSYFGSFEWERSFFLECFVVCFGYFDRLYGGKWYFLEGINVMVLGERNLSFFVVLFMFFCKFFFEYFGLFFLL